MSCPYRKKSSLSIQNKENNKDFKSKFGELIVRIALFLLVVLGSFTLNEYPSYAAKKQNVLMTMDQNSPFNLSLVDRLNIENIIFLDNLKDVPSNAWDVSEKQNGSVMAWTAVNGHTFDLYVAGKGGVWANPDSTSLFSGFSGVTSINFNDCFHTDNVTSMYGMFYDCASLESIDVGDWDTSNVTTMYGMFGYCSSLKDLDVSNWNTSSLTDTGSMFYECLSLENLDVSNWNTSNVTFMSAMFYECSSLKSLDVSGWDTSNVTDMSYMFVNCTSLKGMDLFGWDASNVTDMDCMFTGCSEDVILDYEEETEEGNNAGIKVYNGDDSLQDSTEITEEADIGISFDSNCIIDELGWVEDVSSTGKNLKAFYDETGVQPFVYFKAYEASLTTDDEKEEYAVSWYDENIGNENTFLYIYFAEEDTNNDVGYMYCVDGDQIESIMDEEAIDIFWNYVNEYWYDTNLSTDEFLIDVFDSTAKAIMNGDSESDAKKSTRAGQKQSENGNEETEVIEDLTEKNDLNVLMPVDQTSPFNMDDSYRSAVNSITFIDTLESMPSDAWDVSEKQDGSVMAWTVQTGNKYDMYVAGEGGVWANPDSSRLFYGFDGLTSIDFNNCFYTDNATLMFGMFYECSSLESLDLNGWDISNVTDMYAIFWNCFALKELDIDKWDTSSLTNTFGIFGNCSSLQSLDLGSWNTSNVTNMGYMFGDCTSLVTLNVKDWDTSNVTDMSEMFYNCQALENLDLSGWDTSSLTDLEGIFEGCPASINIGESNELSAILPTKMYILTGHEEMDLSDSLIQLIEEDIEIESLDLESSNGMPNNAECLLIAAPKEDLSATEAEEIINYLSSGGNVILITEYLGESLPNFNEILEYYSMELMDGIIMENDIRYYVLYPYYVVPMIYNTDITSDMFGKNISVLMVAAQGIDFTDDANRNVKIEPVLATSSNSYIKVSENMTSFEKEDGDTGGPFYIGLLVTEEVDMTEAGNVDMNTESAETKIALFTASSLLDDSANEATYGGNYTLFMNIVNWACD